MCNIAGYAGNRPAAPILLEMLRRQQYYDSEQSTGVATIHEGKLYYRKLVGDVDHLIRETDVLDLPGTIGIAHSRPGGGIAGKAVYPLLSSDERIALVVNGSTMGCRAGAQSRVEIARRLEAQGYSFRTARFEEGALPYLSDGRTILGPELRVLLLEEYLKQGLTTAQALARIGAEVYGDNVTVSLGEYDPESIWVLRTSRPMVAVTDGGESYIATARFGLPDALRERAYSLPLFQPCRVRRDGVTVTPERMDAEPVSDLTPYSYAEGYRRVEEMLRSEKAPLYYDDLEIAIGEHMRDLFPGDHSVLQHAHLLYELLFEFEREGRLKKELREQPCSTGVRHRWFFWIEN